MEVILLERVAKLGQMGEIVRVRDGFGRNYLLARGKALRATEENKRSASRRHAPRKARRPRISARTAAKPRRSPTSSTARASPPFVRLPESSRLYRFGVGARSRRPHQPRQLQGTPLAGPALHAAI